MLELRQIDLSMLAEMLGQHDYGAAYLDPTTGEIYPAFGGEVIGADDEPVDLDETDWISLGGASSHETYDDMADFAAVVADPVVARRLDDALHGRGAFRRFRDVVYDTPQELGKVWNRFRDVRAEIRALDWLEAEDLVDPAAIEETHAERRACAEAALAEAARRPSGSRPTMTLLNGLPAVGKSVVGRRLAERSPGTLCLDVDEVRKLLSGPYADTAEAARSLGLAMAEHHLRTGHEVVVPQLVARLDQLERFEAAAAAAGAAFAHVILQDERAAERLALRPADDPRRPGEDEIAEYAVGLADVCRDRPEVRVVEAAGLDPDGVAELAAAQRAARA